MRLSPVRYTLMVHAQLAPNPTQFHPVHIHLHGLFAIFFIITVMLLLRRIFAATPVTPIALAPRRILAYFVLLFFTSTFGTFHPSILPTLSPLPCFLCTIRQSLLLLSYPITNFQAADRKRS